jgi:propanediol dehydratase small subunit
MKIYNSLRPFRCTKEELEEIANELERDYNAVLNAKLIREASDAYEKRGFLKKSQPDL